MCKWIRKMLLGPAMTRDERAEGIQAMQTIFGRKIFPMNGSATTQYIREFGFPVRDSDGRQYLN